MNAVTNPIPEHERDWDAYVSDHLVMITATPGEPGHLGHGEPPWIVVDQWPAPSAYLRGCEWVNTPVKAGLHWDRLHVEGLAGLFDGEVVPLSAVVKQGGES